MTFLDAQAIVAFLVDEPGAPEVAVILDSGDVAVASINLAEAVDVALRVHGVPRERVTTDLDALAQSSFVVVACDHRVASHAGELLAHYYDRRKRPVSIADCVLVASARPDDTIATADRPVLEVARSQGIAVIPLLDSRGRRPE